METYPVDLAPEQVVHWLLDDDRVHAFDLLVSATRSYQVGELRSGDSASLSDTDREELSEVSEVGLLEVRPRQEPHRWTLRIRVEDDVGPRLPEDEPVPAGDEDIDLATFYEEFIKTDRGVAEVSAEAESPAAKANLNKVLAAILTDRHQRGKSRATSRHSERHR